ncbi:MAG TPA: SigE family RNA polymerase sigma factor [Jatrophihabitantaceae bacterium]|nr:SigE family RNA polymerase sigma factor [Jatrophihabitantaceae bacterium]
MADEAFTAFVQAQGTGLLRFAYLLCQDRARAEDLVQDALVKMLRRWRAAGVADQPVAYARRVVVNEHLGWRRLRASGEVPGTVEITAPDDIDAIGDRDRVWRLMATLPARSRAVLVLRYYEQLSDREIALLLGCAEATVRSIAARAFSTLRVHVLETEEA